MASYPERAKVANLRRNPQCSVLVLSDEYIEKLLIWMGVWRIGAVMCPFNLEINEKQMVNLTAALAPELILYHKDINVQALVGDAPAPRVRFGASDLRGRRG